MILNQEKPPLDGALLQHFGVRGMKWGHRKDRKTQPSASNNHKMSTKKKVAIGVGVAAVGVGVAALVISRSGRVPVSRLRPPPPGRVRNVRNAIDPGGVNPFIRPRGVARVGGAIPMPGGRAHPSAATGKKVAAAFDDSAWKKKVSWVLNDIREANAEQDSYMRKIGLGAQLNAARARDGL